jgi:putative addiction module killer protein
MQKIKEVKFFVSASGKCYVNEWLQKLDAQTRARIHVRLVRLEYGAYGDCKLIDRKLSELRFFFAKGYRIYFTEKNNKLVLLLCAGDKSSQSKDI